MGTELRVGLTFLKGDGGRVTITFFFRSEPGLRIFNGASLYLALLGFLGGILKVNRR